MEQQLADAVKTLNDVKEVSNKHSSSKDKLLASGVLFASAEGLRSFWIFCAQDDALLKSVVANTAVTARTPVQLIYCVKLIQPSWETVTSKF